MTEPQARAFVAQVKQEFPEQIHTSINLAKGGRNGTCHTVRLMLKAQQLILSVYQPDEWESIKQAWSYFLGIEIKEERPVHYLIDGIVMKMECAKGYWYGRYHQGGKSHRKYFGRADPRPVLTVYKKEEEVAI